MRLLPPGRHRGALARGQTNRREEVFTSFKDLNFRGLMKHGGDHGSNAAPDDLRVAAISKRRDRNRAAPLVTSRVAALLNSAITGSCASVARLGRNKVTPARRSGGGDLHVVSAPARFPGGAGGTSLVCALS